MVVTSRTCCGIIFYLIHVCFLQLENAIDPCYAYSTITNEEKRSPSYNFDFDNDTPISDTRLTQDWYRIEMNTGSLLPNQSPGTFRCGTFYPIWLNGLLPTVPKVQVSQPVCVQTTVNDCFQTWNINIKFCCGNYLVYELRTSLVDQSAYCFGNVSSGFNVSEDNDYICHV
ncbi:oncoprotein-induced transcript 3 protein-like [Mytilus trossulus]|uniref:oncoprotein-induced transcript 3 protein-like n=1 Tax=Mytilus trossulus TaxID=6551 RepID=UPI003004C9E0